MRAHSSLRHVDFDATRTAVPLRKTRAFMKEPRILIADPQSETTGRISPLLRTLSPHVVEADDGEGLERAVLEQGPFDLVVSNSRLPGQSGLQVLARVRQAGVTTPFIILASLHEHSLRVFVSDGDGIVLSSRMVNADNFATLAADLIAKSAR